MATKIDLLPGYVGMRRWFGRLFLASVVLIGSLGTILWLIWMQTDLQYHKLETDLATYSRVATLASNSEAAKIKADSDAAPMQTAVDFLVAASQTGAQRAELIELVKLYIYPQAQITSIDLGDGANCSIAGSVAQPNDYYSAVLDFRQGATGNGGLVFQDEPKFNGIPGYGNPPVVVAASVDQQRAVFLPGQPQSVLLPLPIKAQAKLKDPVVVPSDTGTVGAPAAGGAPGAPAPPAPPAADKK